MAQIADTTNGLPTTTIVFTDLEAPGIPGGMVNFIQRPVLNRRGDVLFRGGIARLEPDDPIGTRTLWFYDDGSGTTRLIMRNSEGVAGFTPTGIAPDGTAYYLSVQDDQKAWLYLPDGSDENVATPGTPAPGVPGAQFGLSFNAVGQGEARSYIDALLETGNGVDSTNNRGIWRRDADGALTLLRRSGDPAPAIDGAIIDFPGMPVFNSAGQGFVTVNLREGIGGVDATNNTAIYALDEQGRLDLPIVRTGDTVQGTAGATIETLGFPVINAAGQTVLRATYTVGVGGTGDANNLALLTGNPDTGLSELWRRDDGLPGLPDIDIDSINGGLGFNDRGQVLLRTFLKREGFISSQNDLALIIIDGKTTTFVVQEGDEVPGVPGATFNGISTNFSALNNRGDVVFDASIIGPGIDGFNNLGIWAYSGATGELVEVVRSNQLFDVNDDPAVQDMRTIARPDMPFAARGNTGRGTSLTDEGFFTPIIEFTDGTEGLFRMQLPGPVATDGCAGDFDRDADVDLGDLGAFGMAFGSTTGDANYSASADIDEDGDVDLGDFSRFAADFGRTDCFKD